MKNTLLFICSTNILSGTFANLKYEKLSYPKNPKMCDPILVTLLNIGTFYVHELF